MVGTHAEPTGFAFAIFATDDSENRPYRQETNQKSLAFRPASPGLDDLADRLLE